MNDDTAHVMDGVHQPNLAIAHSWDRERWTPSGLTALQQERLGAILGHATSSSRYYREVIGNTGNREIALRELPILTRKTLMDEFDRILCSRRLSLDVIERHRNGDTADEPLFDKFRIFSSGARTGQPATAVYDRHAWDLSLAGMRRALENAGISAQTRIIGVGLPATHSLATGLLDGLRDKYSVGPQLDIAMPMSEIVRTLNEFRPQVVFTCPSFIRPLALEQEAGRLRIHPPMFCSTGEPLTQEVRELAHRTWGALVLNVYMAAEVGLIAMECPFTQGLHVAENMLLIENVDARNEPVPAGIAGQKVLITTLFNRTLPLIRYEMPDLVTAATTACGCGRHGLRLAYMDGSRENSQMLPLRDGGKVPLHALHLQAHMLRIPELRNYHVAMHRGAMTVRVTLRKVASKAHALTLVRKAVQAELDRVGVAIERLTIEAVDEMQRLRTRSREKLVRGG